jgi:uncharacterized RDD family membrane protein YckC
MMREDVSSMGTRPSYSQVVTPEAVPIELDLAGLGSRGIAIIIDMLIQFVCLIGLLFVLASLHPSEAVTIVTVSIASFMLFFGYFFVFEGLWHGRTPGKATQRLRAVRADGQPMSTAQMFVRNTVRIVDFLPAYYAIGCTSMVLTKRSQRLGDLAGGTVVIREPKAVVPQPMRTPPPPPAAVAGPVARVDASAMTESHYQLARSFLQRRDGLEPHVRSHLAATVAGPLRAVVRTSEMLGDERLIELAADAYRRRFASG